MQDLITKIKHYREQYWNTGETDITDSEYEALLQLLREKDPDNELLNEIESAPISNKVSHITPMLSLQKVFSFEEVVTWMTKVARDENELFYIQPKLDGLSGKYYVDEAILSTRGDGYNGENITDKLPKLKLISPKADNFNDLTDDIIGEIICSFKNFEAINSVSERQYKTPRNLAAGVINSKELLPFELELIDYDSFNSALFIKSITFDIFTRILNEFGSEYPLDGIVIKLADKEYAASLGATDHHPRGAIAYKEKAQLFKTKIVDVILQPGKNKYTPVGVVEPVIIDGVTVTRVSLHNAKLLIDNNIHIGDTVYIMRSGGVIPYASAFEPGEERSKIIFNNCEFCNSSLNYIEPELYCSNEECPGNTKIQLLNAAKTLGIDNLGLPTIEKMIDTLNISTIYDIIMLDFDDIMKLDGFKDTSSAKLFDNLHKIMDGVEDYRIIASLNIPGIGIGLLKQVLSKVNIQQLLQLSVTQLIGFDQFSVNRAKTLVEGLQSNNKLLHELLDVIQVIETKETNSSIKKTICFSGTFNRPKQYYYNIAAQKGYEVVDSVTSKLDILVTAGAVTSKVTKAQKNGHTKVIDLEAFLNE